MWYGQSEAQYRDCFRAAREAGEADPETPCVIFLDEVDSVGESRGQAVGRVNDQVLAALLAELDGLEGRGNVLVVAATNRIHALDPALLRPGRLGDLILDIPRPERRGAQSILEKYLPSGVPYRTHHDAPDVVEVRTELIAAAVSRIYADNADSDLATLRFRDGKERRIAMRDLVSGANLANLAGEALERACKREADGGASGLCTGDVFDAIRLEFGRAARALTPANCRNHVGDLPQDADVVSVEPLAGTLAPHTYLRRV
jgi:SpoVK/Ycf46/Vps4 family AAA+-type ATPase